MLVGLTKISDFVLILLKKIAQYQKKE